MVLDEDEYTTSITGRCKRWLDSFTVETNKGQGKIKDVYEYCPCLADKVGLKSNVGPEELAKKLVRAVK